MAIDFSFIEDETLRKQAEEQYEADQKEVLEAAAKAQEAAIEEAVSGLKSNNEKLLNEKKKLQEKFKGITDPEEALAALQLIHENEDIQLIKEGKIEEVIAKRTSTLISEHEAQMEELSANLKTLTEESSKYKSLFQTKVIEDTLREAAIKAGVMPEAVSDVLMRGVTVFTLSETNEVEARNEKGELLKKGGIVVNPNNWVEGLKETHPYYWPPTVSAGISGAGGADSDTMDKLAELAKAGKIDEYRKLRKKMTGN